MSLKYGANGKYCVEWVEMYTMNRVLGRINWWGLVVGSYMGSFTQP